MSEVGGERIPRIRRAAIPTDALLVVRGEDADDPEVSIRQALQFRRRYPDWGRYGLSGFYARSSDEVLDLGADQLERFKVVLVFRLVDVLEAGLEVVPTFRSPHVTIAFDDDPADGLARLLETRHERMLNPSHREEGR